MMKNSVLKILAFTIISTFISCGNQSEDAKIQEAVNKALAEKEASDKAQKEAYRQEIKRIAHDEAIRAAGEKEALDDRVTRAMGGY